ncbi:hypothetical protein KC949_01625 [Candidatus Saccharibacteria bacterium]|nr:hypothetical protein [Candidatus Saccharibacteria bacterium]
MTITEAIVPLAIITFAALCHASFQLSTSMLTMLSGHAIGRQTARRKLARLITAFILGAAATTALLLSTLAFWLDRTFTHSIPLYVWSIATGLAVGVGISVWLIYYRRKPGTTLWIPRGFANLLARRSKKADTSAEAFTLGFTGVIAEILFVIAPLTIAALILLRLQPGWQLAGVALYTLLAITPLLIVSSLVSMGQKLSRIQKWREANKRFLQFIAGAGLIVLGAYIYVDHILAATALGLGEL